jgi:hypothetical protein
MALQSRLSVGLLGAYSNGEIQARLRRLAKALDRLAASEDPARPSVRQGRKLRNGLVPRAIQKVLVDAPGPMRACEIHAEVEELLRQPVPIPSINCWLTKGIRDGHPHLVRLGRGRYRWLNIDRARRVER